MADKAEKRNSQCKSRAESRFVPGKTPELLSPYYRLSCDAGTSLINTWGVDENTEPLYFCEAHANEFKSSPAFRRGTESAARRNKLTEHEQKGHKGNKDQAPAVSPAAVAVILGRAPSAPIAANSDPSPHPMRSASAERTGDRAEARTEQRAGDRAEARTEQCAAVGMEQRAEARTETRSGQYSDEPTEQRCDAIERQIQELVSQMENILSQSDAAIDVAAAIDAPIEDSILTVIDDAAMSDTEKDAAMARLGELQKRLKSGIGERMHLPEAYRLKRALEACLSAELGIPRELTFAYRALHSSIERAIRSALAEQTGYLVGTS